MSGVEELAGYRIEQATIKDVPTALELRVRMNRDTGVHPDALVNDVAAELDTFYHEAYTEGEMVHFFAYDANGAPVASAGALLKRDFPYRFFKPGYYGWIIDVYTEPRHRGRGLAALLVSRAQKWLADKGAQEVKLIAASPGARRIYTRLGYRPTWEMSLNLTDRPTYNEIIDARGKKD